MRFAWRSFSGLSEAKTTLKSADATWQSALKRRLCIQIDEPAAQRMLIAPIMVSAIVVMRNLERLGGLWATVLAATVVLHAFWSAPPIVHPFDHAMRMGDDHGSPPFFNVVGLARVIMSIGGPTPLAMMKT